MKTTEIVVRCTVDGCGAEQSTKLPEGTEWMMHASTVLFPRKAPLNKPCITRDRKHFCAIKGSEDFAKLAVELFKRLRAKK